MLPGIAMQRSRSRSSSSSASLASENSNLCRAHIQFFPFSQSAGPDYHDREKPGKSVGTSTRPLPFHPLSLQKGTRTGFYAIMRIQRHRAGGKIAQGQAILLPDLFAQQRVDTPEGCSLPDGVGVAFDVGGAAGHAGEAVEAPARVQTQLVQLLCRHVFRIERHVAEAEGGRVPPLLVGQLAIGAE